MTASTMTIIASTTNSDFASVAVNVIKFILKNFPCTISDCPKDTPSHADTSPCLDFVNSKKSVPNSIHFIEK